MDKKKPLDQAHPVLIQPGTSLVSIEAAIRWMHRTPWNKHVAKLKVIV